MFTQHAQHAPLLVGQAVLAQAGPGVLHHGLARFEQQAWQVAVDKRGFGAHLFNMLNDFQGPVARVFPDHPRGGENVNMIPLRPLFRTRLPLM
ncbi:hypothetical protein D9M69_732210 [compost metagenome]